MKYEVSIRFKKKVDQKELAGVIKEMSSAKIKGFDVGEISTSKAWEDVTTEGAKPVYVKKSAIIQPKKDKKK